MQRFIVEYKKKLFTERERRGAGEARRRKPTRECVRAHLTGLYMEVAAAI